MSHATAAGASRPKAASLGASTVSEAGLETSVKVDSRPAAVTSDTSCVRPAATATSASETTFASITVSTTCTTALLQSTSAVTTVL